MSLALFDLDNTLIAGDSDHLWGQFLVEQGVVDSEYYRHRNDEFYRAYQRGQLDIMAYLRFALAPLRELPPGELESLHRRFMAEKIEPLWLPRAEELIRDHRQRGDTLVIITSTNRFITTPIAHRLGVHDLLATELESEQGRYTGHVLGEPCYREGKIGHLTQWLRGQSHDLADSCFYSDSINDLPLLEQVARPVAVDPDPELAARARERQWPIISLRGDS